MNAKLNKVNAVMDQRNNECEKKLKGHENQKTLLLFKNFKLKELNIISKNDETIHMFERTISSMINEQHFNMKVTTLRIFTEAQSGIE